MSRTILTSLILASTAFLNGCLSPPSGGAVTGDFTRENDVIFTPDSWPAPLVADIYKPSSGKPTPAVLLIHGGGWNKKERRSDMTGIAKDLARRGYFVMNTTYRLTPEWKYPAQSDDIAEALRYMRRNSKTLNIAPDRVATFGYSAGGHLAALAGLMPENNVKAIVAGGAPTNLAFWPDGKLTGLLLGGPYKGNEKIYREASPVNYVKRDSPPVFIYHGTDDTLVSVEHPKAFISALEKKGVDHEVYWIEGRSHIMTHLFSAKAIPRAIDFLDKNL